LPVGVRQVLLQPGDADTRTQPAFTRIRRNLARQHLEQSGFARPIATQQADVAAFGDAQADSVEQNQRSEVQRHFVEAQQRHDGVRTMESGGAFYVTG
jgi:aspartate/methionine/tyrosine aminotransferase